MNDGAPLLHGLRYHPDMEQGSDAWMQARCGVLTASEMKKVVTAKTLKPAADEKERAHLYELLAQRITGHVEPGYVSDAMLRGQADEIEARDLYAERYAPVTECGFITNDRWGFTIGYSPDGLVGDDGLIEVKSRGQRFQVETIISGKCPADYMLQVQTGLLVTGRAWLDFISYSGGLPMLTVRVLPDPVIQDAIVAAARAFEVRLTDAWDAYNLAAMKGRTIPTERRVEVEMHI